MNLEALKQINEWGKAPLETTTDKEWQQYFSFLKLKVKASKERKLRKTTMRDSYFEATQSEYHGDTAYAYYCIFINDILKNIRGTSGAKGQRDYCYYIYQIADLLRFEHENLRTRWIPQYKCFEVWLENKKG